MSNTIHKENSGSYASTKTTMKTLKLMWRSKQNFVIPVKLLLHKFKNTAIKNNVNSCYGYLSAAS